MWKRTSAGSAGSPSTARNTSNAINPALATDLSKFIEVLAARPSVRVIVLQGRGKNFCAGFDLNHIGDVTGGFDQALSIQRLMSGIIAQMRRIPQPIIAAVQGAASGAGFALALAADVRIAAPDTRMNVAMARIGLTGCDMGTSYFLPRLVGRSVAAELMMTGRFIDAARAVQLGLVSEVVPAAELQAHVLALAEDMLRMSPAGLQLTKEGLEAAQDAGKPGTGAGARGSRAVDLHQAVYGGRRGGVSREAAAELQAIASARRSDPPNSSSVRGQTESRLSRSSIATAMRSIMASVMGFGLHARQQRRMAQRDRPHGQRMQQLLAVPGKALLEIKALPGNARRDVRGSGRADRAPSSAGSRPSVRR